MIQTIRARLKVFPTSRGFHASAHRTRNKLSPALHCHQACEIGINLYRVLLGCLELSKRERKSAIICEHDGRATIRTGDVRARTHAAREFSCANQVDSTNTCRCFPADQWEVATFSSNLKLDNLRENFLPSSLKGWWLSQPIRCCNSESILTCCPRA